MNLQKGINLGGFLSQCEHTEEHYDSFIGADDLRWIAQQGFDHVRLPIDYEVFETEAGAVIEKGFDRVREVIEICKSLDLNIIIDLHRALGYDFNDAGDKEKNLLFTNAAVQGRFTHLWERIAQHYAQYDNVTFELLNEVVEKENVDAWNDLIDRTVAAIRAIAPTTPIIYGGIQWNSAKTLKYLKKPADENIIFTFHFYEPLLFTHQKAHWVKNIPMYDIHYPAKRADYLDACKAIGEQGEVIVDADVEVIDKEFLGSLMQEAIAAAKNAGAKLYCGEFGVIDQAPTEDSLRWLQDVFALFREYNIGSALWSYKEMDFGLTEKHYDVIRSRVISSYID